MASASTSRGHTTGSTRKPAVSKSDGRPAVVAVSWYVRSASRPDVLHRAGEGALRSPFEPPASRGPAQPERVGSRPVPRAGAAIAERRAEHGRGSGGCSPVDRQPHVVRADRNVAQFAAPTCDWDDGPCHTRNHIPPAGPGCRNAPRPLGRSRPRGKSGRPRFVPRVVPGATPRQTCGFAAHWVFPSHTHRAGSLPAYGSILEGGERPRPPSGRPASRPRGGP